MKIIKSISDWKTIRNPLLKTNTTLGFVPTMGNLHQGHQSLLIKSKEENDLTVLSIFINPTQFNNTSDLKNYPRTIEQDIKLAEEVRVDYLFLPSEEQIYPDHYQYQIKENKLSQVLEGEYRPGHFEGMLTIVLKLLLIIKPTRAYFGEKDYQQLQLVKGMAEAFFLDTEIVPCPIIRLENNLPFSSRNNRLSSEQFKKASQFAKSFHSSLTCEQIKEELIKNNIQVDYIEDYLNRRLAAVRIDDIRLIDNRPIK